MAEKFGGKCADILEGCLSYRGESRAPDDSMREIVADWQDVRKAKDYGLAGCILSNHVSPTSPHALPRSECLLSREVDN